MLFKVIESICYLFLGLNIIPLFMERESDTILLAIFFSAFYASLQNLKIPKNENQRSIYLKDWNWIFTLNFILNIVWFIISRDDFFYIYTSFLWLITLFDIEIREIKKEEKIIDIDREDILDSGEFGKIIHK